MNKPTRPATKSDFYPGAVLFDKLDPGFSFTITDQYSDGIWHARRNGQLTTVFECEAAAYTVASK